MDSLVRLVIVSNEPESHVVCGLLDAGGVRSMSRITDLAFGQGGEFPLTGGGPREVLVRREDVERARQLLAEAEAAAVAAAADD